MTHKLTNLYLKLMNLTNKKCLFCNKKKKRPTNTQNINQDGMAKLPFVFLVEIILLNFIFSKVNN